MAHTILDALVKPNPSIDSSFVNKGGNSINKGWVAVETWRPWEDFTYDNLKSTYQKVLLSPWNSPPSIHQGSTYDHQIRDEHSIDLFLARFMFPIVNGALERTSKVFDWGNEVLYLGPGSWTGTSDWSLVSPIRSIDGSL